MESDQMAYSKFTGPARLNKAVHTLEGIVRGIAADGEVRKEEVRRVRDWLDEHREFADRHPFCELIPVVDRVLQDGAVDSEEVADVLWLCEKLSEGNHYYDAASADMQVLHGMLGGILADRVVTKEELDCLSEWIQAREHLRGCWPYDEIDSLITAVLSDGKVDAEEQQLLLSFFSQFSTVSGNRAVDLPLNEVNTPITGVCAVCPEVSFASRIFCFTGASKRCKREELAARVISLGGSFCNTITRKVNYLVIGADGNPCWAYACYGRKVESAVQLRKEGHPIILVHEHDFWDAVEAAKSSGLHGQ